MQYELQSGAIVTDEDIDCYYKDKIFDVDDYR